MTEKRFDGSEAVSIDDWLQRIANGYAEYRPKHELPVYVQPNYTARKEYVPRGRPRTKRKTPDAKPVKYKENPRKADVIAAVKARITRDLLDACVVTHPHRKKKWEPPHAHQCFDLAGNLIVGECAVCGITLTEGVGSRLEDGVLCGRCTDNYEIGFGAMTRARFPHDIGPNTPGDGRIVRKSTHDKDLEVRWWPHKKNR